MTPAKFCAACGQPMPEGAAFCPGCGSSSAATIAGRPSRSSADALGLCLAIAPIVGVALIWLWVANSPVLVAGNNLALVVALVVVGTSVAAAIDAGRLGFGSQPKESGPASTFIASLLAWVVVFPIYMFRRQRRGGRRYGWLAVGGMLAFAASIASIFLMLAAWQRDLDKQITRVTRDAAVAEITAGARIYADAMCACPNADCARAFDAQYMADLANRKNKPVFTQEERGPVEAASKQAVACAIALGAELE